MLEKLESEQKPATARKQMQDELDQLQQDLSKQTELVKRLRKDK